MNALKVNLLIFSALLSVPSFATQDSGSVSLDIKLDLPEALNYERIRVETTSLNVVPVTLDEVYEAKLTVPKDEHRVVTATYTDGMDNTIAVVGYLPVESYAFTNEMNATSTAVGLIWNFLSATQDYKSKYSLSERTRILSKLYDLKEMVALGEYMFKEINDNPEYMATFQLYQTSEYMDAIKAASKVIPNSN